MLPELSTTSSCNMHFQFTTVSCPISAANSPLAPNHGCGDVRLVERQPGRAPAPGVRGAPAAHVVVAPGRVGGARAPLPGRILPAHRHVGHARHPLGQPR